MKKTTSLRSVEWLSEEFVSIDFPEYQREPNVWERGAKQRLIDSIVREFDIASLYLYEDEDGSIDCIDGRQRIGAIMSFLGENPEDLQDNGFDLRFSNEIYEDEGDRPFSALDGLSFAQIRSRAEEEGGHAQLFVDQFWEYKLTVVQLSESRRPEEFNLQFTRLNLGTIINSGEKLHAMVGQLRDACFEDGGIGAHPFLAQTSIPTRRFAREQVAAQIVAQVFSLRDPEAPDFARTRHFDLQRLFKKHAELSEAHHAWIADIRLILDLLVEAFEAPRILKNRAITVSTVLLALRQGVATPEAAEHLAEFVSEFLCRLKWQVDKYRDLEPDPEYRYLIDFQRHVTQASVEKPAVEARASTLEVEFERWRTSGTIRGDDEYRTRVHREPSADCRAGAAPVD